MKVLGFLSFEPLITIQVGLVAGNVSLVKNRL
jgi:hypothetical protein